MSVTKTNSKENSANKPDLMSLSSLRTESDDYWNRVLALCEQRNPAHFGLEFPSWAFAKFEYLDSGTYSHVIKAIDIENGKTPVVFKVSGQNGQPVAALSPLASSDRSSRCCSVPP